MCFSDHDLYTDYRRELGEKNFLILPGWRLLQYCLMMRKYGQTASYEWNSRNREHAKGALESTFSHMEKVEPDIYYGTDWDGNKTGKNLQRD